MTKTVILTSITTISFIVIFLTLGTGTQIIFDFNSYAEIMSLKQQIAMGLLHEEIICKNLNHVLVERLNGKLACVWENTAEKLNWNRVRSEDSKINLWIMNNCELNSTENYKSNSTHMFNPWECQWGILK